MSLSTILKNVFTFGNILAQSSTEAVKHWDNRSLENAFNWANYCEKVAEQTKGKQYRNQLNKQLQSLTLLLTPVTLLDLSLEKLQTATIYIGKILLENQFLGRNLLKVVQNKLLEVGHIQDGNIHRKQSESDRCLHYLIGSSLHLQDPNETFADVIIHCLEKLKKASSNNKRYEKFFQEFLSELTRLPGGWEILLKVLVTDIEGGEDHYFIEEIKKEIFQWIREQDKLTCVLWKLYVALIIEVCSRDDGFSQLYQQYIITWAQSMQPIYGFTENGDLYWWCFQGRETKERCECYSTLCSHVHALLRNDTKIKWKFEKKIRNLSEQSFFNIWTDVLKSVKERLK